MKKLLKKYGLHIIIEIFIIVVGVLIALQVNNWNEQRKQNKQLKGILKKVMDDWESDTIMVNKVIKHYDPFISEYRKVIKQEITDEYMDTCRFCVGLIISYYPVKLESSGLDLLKTHINSGSRELQSDSTINNIIHGQTIAMETMNQMAERIKNDVDENINIFSKKEWFADLFTERNKTPGFRKYYRSTEFRNQTVQHQIYVDFNLLATLKKYKESIIKQYPELEEKYNSL